MYQVVNFHSSADACDTLKKELNIRSCIYLLVQSQKQSTVKNAWHTLWLIPMFSNPKNNDNFESFRILGEKMQTVELLVY